MPRPLQMNSLQSKRIDCVYCLHASSRSPASHRPPARLVSSLHLHLPRSAVRWVRTVPNTLHPDVPSCAAWCLLLPATAALFCQYHLWRSAVRPAIWRKWTSLGTYLVSAVAHYGRHLTVGRTPSGVIAGSFQSDRQPLLEGRHGPVHLRG